VNRPDPTFHFDADPDRRNPDRQAWMPFPIRQNDADPDPQHWQQAKENKTKAMEKYGNKDRWREQDTGNGREKDKTEKGGKQTIRLEADAIIGLRGKQDK